MGPNASGTTSFDAIIQAGRQKKKNEALAKEILGRGRRSNTPQLGIQTNAAKGSLASRITKPGLRSASSASINRPSLHGPLKRTLSNALIERGSGQQALLKHALEQQTKPAGSGFSIKGKAGPYVVVGSNFAPGTTSADIQAAMEPVGGEMVSCMIISASPTVIAEVVFDTKNGADAVIARFNNQMADGRLLHLYHKHGPPATTPLPSAANPDDRMAIPKTNQGGQALAQRYDQEEWDSNEKNSHRAEPEVQDGTLGFSSRDEPVEVDMEPEPDTRYYDRRPYRSEGRNGPRTYERYESGRGSYRDRGGSSRNDQRMLVDNSAQRSDKGLYSDGYSHPSRGRGYR